MAKKAAGVKGSVPARKKAAGKKAGKPAGKISLKTAAAQSSPIKTVKKPSKPSAKAGKLQEAKESKKAGKTGNGVQRTTTKTGIGKQKQSEKEKQKKTGSRKAVKPAKPAPKEKLKKKQTGKEAEQERQKEKKTSRSKTVKTAKTAPKKAKKKAPEQKKRGVKRLEERVKKVVLKKEKTGEKPGKKIGKRTKEPKAVKKKEEPAPKEKKALPARAEKIPKPEKKVIVKSKAAIPQGKKPEKVQEIVTKEATGEEPKDTTAPAPLMALPTEYGENEIAILIVEPRKIFLFWEVRESTLRIFHGDLHIRVYDVTGEDLQDIGGKFCLDISVADRIGSIYLDVLPAREYIADIGILYEEIFITIARSNRVATPRGAALDEGIPAPEVHGEEPRIGY